MPIYQPTGISIEINRKRREARKRRPMTHVENGWPHHRNGRCLCLDTCCHDENNGCICKECICRTEDNECHANITPFILSEDAQLIINGKKPSTLTDTVTTITVPRKRPTKLPEKPASKHERVSYGTLENGNAKGRAGTQRTNKGKTTGTKC
jgi:hypothetical protein